MNKTLYFGILFATLNLVFFPTQGCNITESSDSSVTANSLPTCTLGAIDPENDGTGWEENRTSCTVYPVCQNKATPSPDNTWGYENGKSCLLWPICSPKAVPNHVQGWGWEKNQSCKFLKTQNNATAQKAPTPVNNVNNGKDILFNTTYYPFNGEHYYKTTCGDANNHGGLYFAVTEQSPFWPGSCENESWAICDHSDCQGKWDKMPNDVKRVENGQKMVREPRCNVPCGKKFIVSTKDKSKSVPAVIYDACPSQHWNNRYKEVYEGKNPCAKGSLHLDLRKPLYQQLNKTQPEKNIEVYVRPAE